MEGVCVRGCDYVSFVRARVRVPCAASCDSVSMHVWEASAERRARVRECSISRNDTQLRTPTWSRNR